MFLETEPFYRGDLIWVQLFLVSSYNPFYFWKIGFNVASLISDFSYLNILSFFLSRSSEKLIDFVDLFEEPTLVLMILSIVFLFSIC